MNTQTQLSPPQANQRFNLWLTPELRQRLEAYSARTGCPMGEAFRRAIAVWLQQQEQNVRPA